MDDDEKYIPGLDKYDEDEDESYEPDGEEEQPSHQGWICDKIDGGSVAEWLKAHDSKSCGQQCLGGSNPLASARQ